MMFATLDDLEGSVELLVFGRALAAYEEALALDSVVLVRGQVDHKERDHDLRDPPGGHETSSRPRRRSRERASRRARSPSARRRCACGSTRPSCRRA